MWCSRELGQKWKKKKSWKNIRSELDLLHSEMTEQSWTQKFNISSTPIRFFLKSSVSVYVTFRFYITINLSNSPQRMKGGKRERLAQNRRNGTKKISETVKFVEFKMMSNLINSIYSIFRKYLLCNLKWLTKEGTKIFFRTLTFQFWVAENWMRDSNKKKEILFRSVCAIFKRRTVAEP